jgi:hypothetical protein
MILQRPFRSDRIHVIHDAAIPELCEALMTAHRLGVEAGGAGKVDYDWRRCTILSIPNPTVEESERLCEIFRVSVLLPCWSAYREEHGRGTLNPVAQFEKPQIVRYDVSEEAPEQFHAHSDGWDVDSSTRVVSAVLFLNDVDQGGELEFPEIGIAVQPRRGTMVLFPSAFTHVHQAHPPRSGTKFSLVTWLHWPGDVQYACVPL